MRILLIVDPDFPVPPKFYGGIERVVHILAIEWTKQGHIVDLLASKGSTAYGKGKIFFHKHPGKTFLSRAYRKILFQFKSLWAARNCDVVCNFGRFDYLEALLLIRKPVLQTFENPINQSLIDYAEKRVSGNFKFHCISTHQFSCAQFTLPAVVIPNPIDVLHYYVGSGAGGYLAFLGRLTYNKGVDIAIKASILSAKKLVIAGPVPNEPGASKFFESHVEPFLNSELISWIGPVDDVAKQKFLGNAEALLFPIRWDEPFGIVMGESLACGTPVIATRRASTPDVIISGKTGFLCPSQEPDPIEFSEAISRIPSLNRHSCREDVVARFSAEAISKRLLTELAHLVSK